MTCFYICLYIHSTHTHTHANTDMHAPGKEENLKKMKYLSNCTK